MTEQEFRNAPVEYNNSFQAQKGYAGNDILQQATLRKGEIIVALELANGGGDYFLPFEEFKKRDLDSAALCQDVQVSDWINPNTKENPNRAGEYKPTAKLYYVNKDIEVATGKATENCQYGKGGATQIVIPYAKQDINKLYEGEASIEEASIVPLDLKDNIDKYAYINTEVYKDIKDRCAQQLMDVKQQYKDNINERGCIDLENKDVTPEAARLIEARANLQTSQIVHNSLLKELTSELSKPNRDEDFINLLYEDINKAEEDIDKNKTGLNTIIDIIKDRPETIESFIDKEKEFLMDTESAVSRDIKLQNIYLNAKLNSIEQALNNGQQINFVVDKKMEFDIEQRYANIIAEFDIRNEDFKPREQVHRQSAPMEKIELLSAYKQKEQLQESLSDSSTKKTYQNYIQASLTKIDSQINELDNQINKLEQKIKDKHEIYSENKIDSKIEYMRDKTNHSINESRYSQLLKLNMEQNINEYLKDVYNKYNIDPMKEHKLNLLVECKTMELLSKVKLLEPDSNKEPNIISEDKRCSLEMDKITKILEMKCDKKVETNLDKQIDYLKEKIEYINNTQVDKQFKRDAEIEKKIDENVSGVLMKDNKVKQRHDTLNQRIDKNISQVSKDKSIGKKDKNVTNNDKHKSIKIRQER